MLPTSTTGTVHNGQSPGPATMRDATGCWELVSAAQRGDRDAFGALYQQYAGEIARFVMFRTGDRVLAQDLTSETFTRGLRRIDSVSYRGQDVGAWFTTIARNLITDHYKSSRHKLEQTVADPQLQAPALQDHSPERVVIARETAAGLRRAVALLPTPDQQECIRLRFFQERSIAETAAMMGRSQEAVKALTHRALLGLRAQLTGGSQRVPPPRQPPDPLARARRAVTQAHQQVTATHHQATAHHVTEQNLYVQDQAAAEDDRAALALSDSGAA